MIGQRVYQFVDCRGTVVEKVRREQIPQVGTSHLQRVGHPQTMARGYDISGRCRSPVAQRRAARWCVQLPRRCARALWYRQIAAADATLRLSALPGIGIHTRCVAPPANSLADHVPPARTATPSALRGPRRRGTLPHRLSSPAPGVRPRSTPQPRGPRLPRTPPGWRRCFPPRLAGTCRCTDPRCGRPARRHRRPSRRRRGSTCPHFPVRRSPPRPPRSRGAPASTSSSVVSGTEHTATSPTGVTVSDNAFAARSVTRCNGNLAQRGTEPGRRRLRREHLGDESAPQRGLDEVGAFGEESVRRGVVRRGGAA